MILAINTSTPQFSIALMEEDSTVVAEYSMSSGSKNFRHFAPGIDFLLSTSRLETTDIKALIVALGPGSFTGLRVGLSHAKGMAQALQIPIIGVSSLEALAFQVPYAAPPLCPLIDSRKDEVFTALFRWNRGQKLVRTHGDTSLRFRDLPTWIKGPTIVVGNDFRKQAHLVMEIVGDLAEIAPAPLWNLRASAVGSLGLERFLLQDFDSIQDLVPTYLRPPDIRPNPFAPRGEQK